MGTAYGHSHFSSFDRERLNVGRHLDRSTQRTPPDNPGQPRTTKESLLALGESFEVVLAAARTGADWAWEALYRDLAPLVHGYLRSRGAREPEDLTGEVFLGIARGLPS